MSAQEADHRGPDQCLLLVWLGSRPVAQSKAQELVLETEEPKGHREKRGARMGSVQAVRMPQGKEEAKGNRAGTSMVSSQRQALLGRSSTRNGLLSKRIIGIPEGCIPIYRDSTIGLCRMEWAEHHSCRNSMAS